MTRLHRIFFCFGFITFLLSACQKEYSYDAGDLVITPPSNSGTAEFSFLGAPGNCTTPAINGTYQQGIATGDTNTVIVQVDVTDTGSYTISSGTVNNITFSAAGNFTVSGPQTILLKASGIPQAGGSFNFTPGTGGCTFTITFKPGTVVPPVIPPVNSTECKACSYVPVCVGSKYEFADSTYGIVSLRYIEYMSSSDTILDGKPFTKIIDNTGAASYFNCTNGETTLIGYQVTSAAGNVLEKFESVLVKANAAVGATWESNIINPIGQQVTQKYKIISKGSALSAGGFNFPDVIQVMLETGMELPVVGFMVVSTTDYYYAKGVGMVLAITKDANSGEEFSRSVVKSYLIP